MVNGDDVGCGSLSEETKKWDDRRPVRQPWLRHVIGHRSAFILLLTERHRTNTIDKKQDQKTLNSLHHNTQRYATKHSPCF
jgi:hypothetical protein